METNAKPKILIVEDDSISIFVLKKMLNDHFQIFTASNSEEAFKVLHEHYCSLILMDINLGEDSMDGTAIMKQIKQTGKYGDPAVLAVTSYAMPEDRTHFLSEGFDDYLPKPIKKEELFKSIDTRLV